MPIEITMPRLSDTMEQGTVVKWHKAEGDAVSVGEVIADIETDKATMELEAFDDGTLAKQNVTEGQTVAVGSVIAVLAEEGEDVSAAASGAAAPKTVSKSESGSDESSSATATATAAPPATTSHTTNGADTDRVFASPLARKIAAERGIDLSSVSGTGPSGRITRKDVESVAPGAAPSREIAPAATASKPSESRLPAVVPSGHGGLEHRVVDLSNMRGTIARRLVESKTSIPHYQVTLEVDMDALVELREKLNEQLAVQGVKLTVNDFIVRACALAMHQHPFINSRWVDQGPKIEILPDINVGVAIALPEERGGGLVVATLRNTDQLGLRQISHETKRLSKKAREKGLTIDEMADATFTISNLGMFGVEHFTAIINPPNAAILAVGAAIQKPVVVDGELTVGWRMQMTISSDHRVIDGAMAAAYLATVKQLLEQPATLLV